MFGFGAAFWMTPLTTSFFMASLDDETAGRRLREMFPASGTYYVPSLQHPPERLSQLHEAGPVATIHIQREGRPVRDAKMLAVGFVHELISMTLAALVMGALLSVLNTYVRRCGFTVMLGVLIAWFGPISQPIWWHQPWPVHLVNAVYTVLAWLVAGLVLAAFIKPAGPSAK
jgi:hypothetical protein